IARSASVSSQLAGRAECAATEQLRLFWQDRKRRICLINAERFCGIAGIVIETDAGSALARRSWVCRTPIQPRHAHDRDDRKRRGCRKPVGQLMRIDAEPSTQSHWIEGDAAS